MCVSVCVCLCVCVYMYVCIHVSVVTVCLVISLLQNTIPKVLFVEITYVSVVSAISRLYSTVSLTGVVLFKLGTVCL